MGTLVVKRLMVGCRYWTLGVFVLLKRCGYQKWWKCQCNEFYCSRPVSDSTPTLPFNCKTSQNGQIHSNNSLAVTDDLFVCVWPFYGAMVKGIIQPQKQSALQIGVAFVIISHKKNWVNYYMSVDTLFTVCINPAEI